MVSVHKVRSVLLQRCKQTFVSTFCIAFSLYFRNNKQTVPEERNISWVASEAALEMCGGCPNDVRCPRFVLYLSFSNYLTKTSSWLFVHTWS